MTTLEKSGRKIKKFKALIGRRLFYFMDRFVSICSGKLENRDLLIFEESERLGSEAKLVTDHMRIDLAVINYKYGTILIPEERMKKFLLNAPIDNFEKLKYMKELYLI